MQRIKQKIRDWFGKEIVYVRITIRILKSIIKECLQKNNYKYPHILQLPITYKCNFDCVMCGMKKQKELKDFSADELGIILENPLFSKIESVGLNGGEPFLKKDLIECVDVIIKSCPSLQQIDIISNGYCTDIIIEKMIAIKKMCVQNHIRVGISFSLDGIDDMQDLMRGKTEAYEHLMETYRRIRENTELYCDRLGFVCTITTYNISRIGEVELWARKNNESVSYNLATIHKRITNEDKYNDFSVLIHPGKKMLAQEFFYKKFLETGEEKYFALFLYLKEGKRYACCDFEHGKGVTLTPNGGIGYCATFSKEIGNASIESAETLFVNNRKYREKELLKNCSGCSHYIYGLSIKGLFKLRKELVNETIRKR